MQRCAKRGHVAEFGIGEHGRELQPAGARLPQQAAAPDAISPETGPRQESARAARASGVSHSSGRYSAAPSTRPRTPVHSAAVTATWQFAILPSAPQVLARHADRRRALFRKARPVEDQHPAALGQHRPQPPPDAVGVPGRVRDEVLKGLIGDRLGDAGQHRLHRLPLAVAEDALHVTPQRQQLRPMAEAAFELLEPAHQSLNARRRRVIDHRAAPYQTMTKSTMSSIQITCETRIDSAI